jgi:hypothetical protein
MNRQAGRKDGESIELAHEDTRRTLTGIVNSLMDVPQFASAFHLQLQTLDEFYSLACTIGGSDCPVEPQPKSLLDLERNFFSMLFLAVTRSLIAETTYMPLYAMVNQGMRAWVTACDNLLDDEYKEVFPFEMVRHGNRVRSVLTLLLADRVISEYVCREYGNCDLLASVGRISLAALMPSAIQESEEEFRPVPVLLPEQLLQTVHRHKTADLFAAPLALPSTLERVESSRLSAAKRAVANFGLACQILDDLKDMPLDVVEGRHNYLVSSISVEQGSGWLADLRAGQLDDWVSWDRFPAEVTAARRVARGLFAQAFGDFSAIGLDLKEQLQNRIVELMYLILRVPAE